jgi:hypothetical protein
MSHSFARTIALTLAVTCASTAVANAQSTGRNACSYLTAAQVAAVIETPVSGTFFSRETCVYSTGRGVVAFVTVFATDLNGDSPSRLYATWLRQAATYAKPVPGDLHAFTVGTSVMALRRGGMVTTNVYARGGSRDVRRGESLRLATPILRELQ